MYGQRIREIRKKSDLTQHAFAQILYSTQSTIGKLEREELEPNIGMILKICRTFKVSADYLLGLEDEYGYPINRDGTYNFEYSHGDTKLIHREKK